MSLTILTIDDSKTIRNIVKKLFDGYDCDVHEAKDGIEGLSIAFKIVPDVVILDIDMPGMNGLEMLMNLRNNDIFMNTPVIMLTSKSKEHNVKLALELGVTDFIAKPFKRDDLLRRIRELFDLAPL